MGVELATFGLRSQGCKHYTNFALHLFSNKHFYAKASTFFILNILLMSHGGFRAQKHCSQHELSTVPRCELSSPPRCELSPIPRRELSPTPWRNKTHNFQELSLHPSGINLQPSNHEASTPTTQPWRPLHLL